MQAILATDFESIIALYSSLLGDHVVVAVSGGADSMALCLLMNEWCQQQKIKLSCITVDHCLRPESANEAHIVEEWLARRNIHHITLKWHHDQITNRIQEKARNARYDLLFKWCTENNATSLLTAHHALDQWETFMIRLSKGSGMKGLCSIRNIVATNFGYLVRPLLNIEPVQLQKTLERFNQTFIHDPSNDQEKFTRIKWRKLYPTLNVMGITTDMIAKSIASLSQVNEWVDVCVIEGKRKSWNAPNLDLKIYLSLPIIVRQRLLNDILIEIGKSNYPINQKTIEHIDKMAIDNKFRTITVGHCLISKKKDFLIVQKENIRFK